MRPNYGTVHLVFSNKKKTFGKICTFFKQKKTFGKILPTYTKVTLLKNQQTTFVLFIFVIFFIKAYVVVTHLNSIDLLMQFKFIKK